MDYFKHNNFDLVRLLAATQVAMLHSMEHLEVPVGRYELLIAYVPGVPAFFFISGFLISASWERNPDIRTFFANRFLSIFPGLWAATLLAAATLLVFGSGVDLRGNLPTFGLWFFTQSTIFQAWTPDFLRGYGVGAVNGSLWTIAVELSFYAFIPVLYLVFRSFGRATAILITIVILSFTVQYVLYGNKDLIGETLMYKLVRASPLPWVGMFCCGILAQRYLQNIIGLFAGRFVHFLLLYIAVSLVTQTWPLPPVLRGASNSMGIVNYTAMMGLLLAIAYTNAGLSDRLLRRNDISYGMYIFHMPIVNVLVECGILGWTGFVIALMATTAISSLSWRWIERPALRLRRAVLFSR
jgi:peptidoglycan/LPS O-acetylase OafA/YrhL